MKKIPTKTLNKMTIGELKKERQKAWEYYIKLRDIIGYKIVMEKE